MSKPVRLALAAGALASALVVPAAAQNARPGLVDDARLLAANDKSDADWITFGQDLSNQRFSSLTGINRTNVARLAPAWIYQLGVVGSTQTHPLVVDGTMYATMANNDVAALNAATGEEIWRYRHKFTREVSGARNRGVAVAYGRVYEATEDGRVLALDQATGKVVWDKPIATFDAAALVAPGRKAPGPIPFNFRWAPLVYDGKVLVGATRFEVNEVDNKFIEAGIKAGVDLGAEWIQQNLGRRAFLAALDAETGNEAWRWYATKEDGWEGDFVAAAPDGTPLPRDVKKERDLAAIYKLGWAAGSSSPWHTPAVDAKAGLLFLGTGNPAPGGIDLIRPGDNLYSNGVVALETKTGKLRWFFQESPHGIYDATSQNVLFDAAVDGRTVPAVVNCGKSGFCYVLDRTTGKLLFQTAGVVRQVNMFSPGTPEGVLAAPGGGGGVGVSPVSLDPTTGLLYVAAIDRPEIRKLVKIAATAKSPEMYQTDGTAVPLKDAWGTVTALDLKNRGKIAWQVKTPRPLVGGVVATAGGLVFVGEPNGRFNAFDAATGASLWSFQTGAAVGAPPMTYAVGGRQFVAVATGAAAPAPGVAIAPGADRPGGAIVAFALSPQ